MFFSNGLIIFGSKKKPLHETNKTSELLFHNNCIENQSPLEVITEIKDFEPEIVYFRSFLIFLLNPRIFLLCFVWV